MEDFYRTIYIIMGNPDNISKVLDELCLEWWNEGKKVTIYIECISLNEINYTFLKVFSPNVDEMEEGTIKAAGDVLLLKEWLDSV